MAMREPEPGFPRQQTGVNSHPIEKETAMSKFRLAIGLTALALASSPVHAAQMKLAAAQAPASDVVYGVFVPLMLGIGF